MNFLKQRMRSFGFAFSGLYEAIKTEMHMKFLLKYDIGDSIGHRNNEVIFLSEETFM